MILVERINNSWIICRMFLSVCVCKYKKKVNSVYSDLGALAGSYIFKNPQNLFTNSFFLDKMTDSYELIQ